MEFEEILKLCDKRCRIEMKDKRIIFARIIDVQSNLVQLEADDCYYWYLEPSQIASCRLEEYK